MTALALHGIDLPLLSPSFGVLSTQQLGHAFYHTFDCVIGSSKPSMAPMAPEQKPGPHNGQQGPKLLAP